MQRLVIALSKSAQKCLCILLATIAFCTSFVLWQQPSYATSVGSDQLTAEEKIERAYDGFSQDAGIREEIVQEKRDRGEDLESQPNPYRRITDLTGKEVPETSLLETTVSKVRDLIEK